MQNRDFVAAKFRGFTPRMGDERFCLGEFQLEFISEKFSELLFDLFGFCLCADNSEQEIIGISDVMEASVMGAYSQRWKSLLVLLQPPRFFDVPLLSFPKGSIGEPLVFEVQSFTFLGPFGVFRDKDGFHKLVERIEQDV